jgi:hypothetical protein
MEFISDRISYITLRGRWCDVVLIVHAPTDDTKDSFNEELERPYDQFPKSHMKILLRFQSTSRERRFFT